MRKLIALFTSVLAGTLLFGDTPQRAASQLYSKPTFAQVMKLTAAVRGQPTDHGPWNDGSVPASYLYSTPTYAQVDALIKAVKESGGGSTNAVTLTAFTDATNLLAQIKVGTNDFITATNELNHAIRFDKACPSKNEFDVWANSTTEIPAGNVNEMPDVVKSLLVGIYGDEVLRFSLSTPIPTQMTHKVVFRTETKFADLGTIDIRVDWGDGTETHGSDVVWEPGVNCSVAAEDELYIVFSHTYAKDGRYTVSVYGDDYFNMRHQMNRPDLKIQDSTYNLVCGVALHDGAVNPLKTNASAMWMNSVRLLSVNAAGRFRHYTNISTLFSGCVNLNEFSGELGDRVRSAPQVFQGCYALRNVNGVTVPVDRLITFQNMFENCYDAVIDLSQLIIRPFKADAITMTSAFKCCRKATGTVPAKFLWDDTGVKWTTGSQSINWTRNIGMWWQPGDIINYISRAFLCTNGYIVASESKAPPVDTAHWIQVDNSYSKFAVNQAGPFAGSSAEVRAQVPVAWGGSNTNIVIPAYTGRKSYATVDDLASATNAIFSFEFKFATNEVTSATYIAATNILNTLGFDQGTLDNIPGGTVYGSLGALLVALAAGLVLLRKKTALLENDGTASGTFATSLLDTDDAKTAVQNIVNGLFDNGDTTAYPRTTGEG